MSRPLDVDAVHCPVTLARTMEVTDANVLGNVHGGVILREVDTAAGVAAWRYCQQHAVTAVFDSLAFRSPVHVGDVLTCHAAVTWTGTTSLEVGVRIEAAGWMDTGTPRHVGSAYVVFVPVDDTGRPQPVRPLEPVSDIGRRWFSEGAMRRQARMTLRSEIASTRRDEVG